MYRINLSSLYRRCLLVGANCVAFPALLALPGCEPAPVAASVAALVLADPLLRAGVSVLGILIVGGAWLRVLRFVKEGL